MKIEAEPNPHILVPFILRFKVEPHYIEDCDLVIVICNITFKAGGTLIVMARTVSC